MKLLEKDSYIIGILLGIISICISFIMIDFFNYVFSPNTTRYIEGMVVWFCAIIPNLILMRFFIKSRKQNQIALGLFLISFVWILIFIFVFGMNNKGLTLF